MTAVSLLIGGLLHLFSFPLLKLAPITPLRPRTSATPGAEQEQREAAFPLKLSSRPDGP